MCVGDTKKEKESKKRKTQVKIWRHKKYGSVHFSSACELYSKIKSSDTENKKRERNTRVK